MNKFLLLLSLFVSVNLFAQKSDTIVSYTYQVTDSTETVIKTIYILDEGDTSGGQVYKFSRTVKLTGKKED